VFFYLADEVHGLLEIPVILCAARAHPKVGFKLLILAMSHVHQQVGCEAPLGEDQVRGIRIEARDGRWIRRQVLRPVPTLDIVPDRDTLILCRLNVFIDLIFHDGLLLIISSISLQWGFGVLGFWGFGFRV
jgi:hypothetical protein